MSNSQIFQIIGLLLALLIGIFRNQLAKVGDLFVANRIKIWKKITFYIKIVISYLLPAFWIIYDSIYKDFSKSYVIFICINFAIIIVSLMFNIFSYFFKTLIDSEKKTITDIEKIALDQSLTLGKIVSAQEKVIDLIKVMEESRNSVTDKLIIVIQGLGDEIDKINKKK